MDAASMFETSLPVLELVTRGSVIFLGLTLLLRVVGQREAGGLAVTDLLLIVLLVQAVAHAFAPESTSLTDALVLVLTLLFWSVALDALSYRFPWAGRLLRRSTKVIVEDGVPNRRAMHREFLSPDELETQLRLHGVEHISEVRRAYLEPNGMVSVFRKDHTATNPAPKPPTAP